MSFVLPLGHWEEGSLFVALHSFSEDCASSSKHKVEHVSLNYTRKVKFFGLARDGKKQRRWFVEILQHCIRYFVLVRSDKFAELILPTGTFV